MRYFISYAGADRVWAFWIGQQLRASEFEVELDEWSWNVGTSFIRNIEHALARADRIIAVCSAAYFDFGSYGSEEREAALRLAHTKPGLIIPVVVANCEFPPLIAVLARINLIGLDEAAARTKLLEKLAGATPPALKYKPEWPGANVGEKLVRPGERRRGDRRRLKSAWNIPHRNTRFTNRSNILGRLDSHFEPIEAHAVAAVYGMGGVGKTQLAIEYAWRNAHRYDIVWWIYAEQEAHIAPQLGALIEQLGLRSSGSATQDAKMALNSLRQSNRSWLVVFDNAPAVGAVREWLPHGTRGHVLVTSRSPEWRSLGESLELRELALADAAAYLQSRTGCTALDTATAIASEVDCLPLALEQLAAHIEHIGVDPGLFLTKFRTQRARYLRRGSDFHYGGSMDTAWLLTLENLEHNAPASAQLVTFLAFLGPEPVPLDLFIEGARALPEPLRASVLSEDSNGPDFDDVVAEVLSLSLLRRDGDALIMHRLIQDVVRTRLSPSDAESAARTIRSLVAAYLSQHLPDRPDSWPRWEQLDLHWSSSLAFTDQRVTVAEREFRQTMLNGCRYRWARGNYAGTKSLVDSFLGLWREHLGPSAVEVLEAECIRGAASYDLGEYGVAMSAAENLTVRCGEVLGLEHPLTLTAASCLARCLRGAARYEEATELNQSILEVRTRVLGEDHPETIATACSLGRSLAGAGRLVEAEQVDRRSVDIRSAALGQQHPDTLVVTNSLVGDLLFLGRVEEAHEIGDVNLHALRDALGDSHPDTLNAAYNFAGVLAARREFDAALALDTDTLDRCVAVFGDGHPNTWHVRTNLATDWAGLGNYSSAVAADRELLVAYQGLLGHGDPATLTAANNLMLDLQAVGDSDGVAALKMGFPNVGGERRMRDWWFSRVR
ncbi:FxSxx-COOH system tetratricopeptide repeat protein [Nocardia salmonicida]|uniref:FxSxx-COOH system tetratricopeptide repeat protein n=1 Tax=Nocardia salmonicida TaxID=53431 RepID=UPI0033C69815